MTTPPVTRVALVEDDLRFRAAFAAAIRAEADLALVHECGTLEEGLRALGSAPADVLLTDLGLPDGSGIELVRAVRMAWPDCEVMVVTVFGDETHVMQALEAGAAGYLLKDSAPESVVGQIRSLREGGSPISPLIARRILLRFRGAAAVPPAPAPATGPLSEREHQVLELIAKGFSHDEIARLLAVSRHTVTTFVRRIYAKLEVRSKTEATFEARRMGLLRD